MAEPEKNIEAIEKELHAAVRMLQYLGKFIYDLSTIMKPMTDLLKSDVTSNLRPSQEAAFKEIKTQKVLPWHIMTRKNP